ncbi:unnamed protein product, partial [Musa banksii]
MDGGLLFVLAILTVTSVVAAALDVTTLFGKANLVRSGDGRSLKLLLDRSSGSGFISTATYHHGLFSASIKLPQGYTAGVVVAFYTSNGDVFEKTHDELDFEFLGNVHGEEWRVQTNVYGKGSTGREERYLLPFDPAKEFHRYSILWTAHSIIFSIDGTPIREVGRCDAMSGDYPSKPMSIYATIWYASDWATSGGGYKVDYDRAPFVPEFSDLALLRCRLDPIQQVPGAAANCTAMAAVMTPKKQREMRAFRQRYM